MSQKAIILSKEESHNLKKRGKLSYNTNSSQITPRRGDLFESVGLDYFINGSFNKGTFYKFFGEFTQRK
jgi:hypothetical protein